MKNKEKQIEEMAKDIETIEKEEGNKLLNETLSYVKKHHKYNSKEDYSLAHIKTLYELTAEKLYKQGYRKLPENARVIIPSEDSQMVVLSREEYDELINLQRTHAEDLTNAIQSYEESKADIKLEYDNHIKSLEKIIDRQSKDLNSQADRLIDLKVELKNKGKETAEKILNDVYWLVAQKDVINVLTRIKEIATREGVEIKE
jgi:hypothetical protein